MDETNDGRQPTYDMCFICGKSNPAGLQVDFFVDGDTVRTEFVPDERHQGYPGILHGGILGALLDETVGRASYLKQAWTMTARIQIRYFKPVRIGQKIVITGQIGRDRGRAMELHGTAELEDGTLVAEASGIFMKLPPDGQREMESLVFGETPAK